MARLTLTLNMDNAAFTREDTGEHDPQTAGIEAGRILRKVADRLADYGTWDYNDERPASGTLLDANGNTVGEWKVSG